MEQVSASDCRTGKAGTRTGRIGEPHTGQGGIACLDSESLLRGHGSVAISHHGTIYRLQATKQGKLILTK